MCLERKFGSIFMAHNAPPLRLTKLKCFMTLLLTFLAASGPLHANGLGENYSWQFATSADRANRAFIEDLRQRKKNGFFAPPIYNTVIERQFNCSINATATGNQGSNSAVAASPSTSGNVAQATANDSQNGFDLFGFPSNVDTGNNQTNTGKILASTNGGVETSVSRNNSEQVINSNQSSTAPQTASVDASTACSFGVLN